MMGEREKCASHGWRDRMMGQGGRCDDVFGRGKEMIVEMSRASDALWVI